MSKKVVIISFTFPPQSGIGGRRWAKFCKEFYRNGIDFQVITSASISLESSKWVSDIEPFFDRIKTIKNPFPNIVRYGVHGFFDKIKYRLAVKKLQHLANGNYYDHSILWKENLIPEVRSLLDLGYNNVIATAGPFAYLDHLISLKKEYPSVNFIADFRDPWTSNRTSFGFDKLPSSRLAFEQQRELSVIRQFDHIVSVSDQINSHFRSIVESKASFTEISNGYDTDELGTRGERKRQKKLKMVFVGTLYQKAEPQLEAFINGLSSLPREMLDSLDISFYGKINKGFGKEVYGLPISFNGEVSLADAHAAIANADVGLLFLTDDLNYSFSTKFFEYVGLDTPILLISISGKTSQTIVEKDIGWHAEPRPQAINQIINKIVDSWKNDKLALSSTFDKTQYSTTKLARIYEDLLVD